MNLLKWERRSWNSSCMERKCFSERHVPRFLRSHRLRDILTNARRIRKIVVSFLFKISQYPPYFPTLSYTVVVHVFSLDHDYFASFSPLSGSTCACRSPPSLFPSKSLQASIRDWRIWLAASTVTNERSKVVFSFVNTEIIFSTWPAGVTANFPS